MRNTEPAKPGMRMTGGLASQMARNATTTRLIVSAFRISYMVGALRMSPGVRPRPPCEFRTKAPSSTSGYTVLRSAAPPRATAEVGWGGAVTALSGSL
eukprot:3752932-Pleurochrysis_carterae.AAC.1